MKNRYLLSVILVCCSIFVFVSCKKEPHKGKYTGSFQGVYHTSANNTTTFTSYYSFQIEKSTAKEIVIEEMEHQTISTLKKQNDSIVGIIGFGNVYSPTGAKGLTMNLIKIRGISYLQGQKSYIEGTFEGDVYLETGKSYLSTGTFVLSEK
ncbi:MAG: hypothetical protein J5606_03765 [Bacteroidales bacterium]|nr:hypothetical protein [Bacteroidales bacterium]